MVDSRGASQGGFEARQGQHEFSWRDAMDIPVRWRQLSEPNDQVSFHNMLAPTAMQGTACAYSHASDCLCNSHSDDCLCNSHAVTAYAAAIKAMQATAYANQHISDCPCVQPYIPLHIPMVIHMIGRWLVL